MAENPAAKSGHTYIMNPESSTEMDRLLLQDRFMTLGMGGIFSERADLEGIQAILDVGCGPGGWTLDVARAYPDRRVVGIDISTRMIAYAQAQASAQGLGNVSFMVMNALQPLEFAEGTFDLVNMRFASGYVQRTQWVPFLQNCCRVLRSGGILRLTEGEAVGSTNSFAFEKLATWIAKMIHAKGYGFSPDGSHLGMQPMSGFLLQEGGCVNIQSKAHIIDFSSGAVSHDITCQDYKILLLAMKPAFIHEGLTTEAEFDQTYEQVLEDMQLPSFRGIGIMITTWGEKSS